MRKRDATWDNLPLPAFSLNDIDDSIVERFKQWAAKKGRIDKSVLDEPKDILMEKIHLMNGSYLTNAATLLYTINPSDIMIEFTAPEDRVIRSVTHKATDRVTDKVTDNLDEKSMLILTLISEDPAYTSTVIAEKLSISRKTVSQRLKEMQEKGIIERIGSNRKGY